MRRPLAFLALLIAPLLAATVSSCAASPSRPVDGNDETVDSLRKSGCTPTVRRVPALDLAVLPEADEAPFVTSLASATTSIRLMVYMLGEDGVFQALIDRAQHGVDVRVILDGGAQRKFNQKAFDDLTAAGVQVQWSDPKFSYMHAKAFVVDDRESIVSTGNFPKSLVEHERNYVARDVALADVATLAAVFDADWTHVDPDLSCTRLLVSPVNSKQRILDLLASAETSVLVESLELADVDVVAAIEAQHAAGRDVRVVLADPAWNSSNDNAQTAAALTAEGIGVRYIPKTRMLVHVKSILVDGKRAYMGSENLTTTSLTKNREIGLVVTDQGALHTMSDTFEADYASALPFVTDSAQEPP